VAVAASGPRGAVAVLNPTPAPRRGLVEAELLVPDEWASVALELPDGSRVATQELSRKRAILFDTELRGGDVDDLFRRFHGREIFDHAWNGYRIDGRAVTLEVDNDPDPIWLDVDGLRAEVVAAMRAAPDDTWKVRIVARSRRSLTASVPAPALGWTAVRAVEGRGDVADGVRMARDGRTMTNGLLAVAADADGTLRLSTPDRVRATGIGRIVDGGDYGDSYNYGPPADDAIVDEPTSVSVRADLLGPVRGRLVVSRTYAWPRGVAPDGSARAAEREPTEVVMTAELRSGEPFLRLGVTFENRSDDHRVRFHVPLPRPAQSSHAEGQFAVVERGTVGEGGYREEPLATFPAHGWVDAGGMAVLLDHLAEYELTDEGREVALTLLRSTGLISRNDNPYRQDPAGPEIAIPNAQMRGRWQMTFGLLPHAGDWAEGGVADAAERYRHGFVTAPGSSTAPDGWPPAGAGSEMLALEGDGVVLTAVRRRAGGWTEVRVVNLAADRRAATLRGAIVEAREASLRGEPGTAIGVADGAIALDLGPAEIRTVQLRRTESSLARAEVLDASGPRQSA
jgi:alpha-mannosidase